MKRKNFALLLILIISVPALIFAANNYISPLNDKQVDVEIPENVSYREGILPSIIEILGQNGTEKIELYPGDRINCVPIFNKNEGRIVYMDVWRTLDTATHSRINITCIPDYLAEVCKDSMDSDKIDTDGDGMSDYFEENIAYIDPSTANERYFLYVDTSPLKPGDPYHDPSIAYIVPFEPINPVGDSVNEERYILKINRFKPVNIIQLLGANATIENFEKAVLEIAKKGNENDIIFIQLSGHGGPGRFYFYDGGISYEDINDIVNNISAKIVVLGVGACYSGINESINPLTKNWSCSRVVIAPTEILMYNRIASGSWKRKLIDTVEDIDRDKNGCISIKEVWLFKTEEDYEIMSRKSIDRLQTNEIEEGWNYTLTKGEGETLHCKICQEERGCWHYTFFDPASIGANVYFGDASTCQYIYS